MAKSFVTSEQQDDSFSIFSYGFRPFFLAAGIYAVLPLVPWVLFLSGSFSPAVPPQSWHAHEMLFGFVAAAISGFLFTAIPKWTNTPPLTGAALKRFFYLWLVGRTVFWIYLFVDHPLAGYLLFIDLLLPLMQAVHIAKIFVVTNSRKNFIFVGIITVLAVANLLVILDLNGMVDGVAQAGSILATNVIMITIAVIGGRVTPNFTRSYLQQTKDSSAAAQILCFTSVERMALWLLILNAVIDIILPHSIASYTIALLAFASHAVRFGYWGTARVLHNPILWVLHLGYIWLIISLFLKGMEGMWELPYNLYLHAFTVGTIGTYVLGIMTRASLGHTGRELVVKPVVVVAYLLISIAAVVRLLTPFHTELFTIGMVGISLLWIIAFMLYLWVYAPILTSPRIDGRAG